MKSIFLGILLTIPSLALAATESTDVGTITRVHFYEGINAALVLHSGAPKNPGCPRADQYALSKNHPFYTEIYSMLLAAATSKTNIALTLSDQECPGNYPYIKHVYYTP